MDLEPGLEAVFFALRDISRPIRQAARETLGQLGETVTVPDSERHTLSREKTLKNEIFSLTLAREMKRVTAHEEFKDYLALLLSIGGRGPSHAWTLFLGNTIPRSVFMDVVKRLAEPLRLRFVHRYLFSEISDRRQQAPAVRALLKEISDGKAAGDFLINLLDEPDESLYGLLARTGDMLFEFAGRLNLADTLINRAFTTGDPRDILKGVLVAGAFDLKDRLYRFRPFLAPHYPDDLRKAILSVFARSLTDADERIAATVSQLLTEKKGPMPVTAFSTLASMGYPRCTEAALALLLERPDLRETMITALVQLKAHDLISVLDRLPDTIALDVRKAVARLLVIEKPGKVEILFGYGRTDEDPDIRTAATLLFQQISEIRTREIKDKILALAPPHLASGNNKPNNSELLAFLKNPSATPPDKIPDFRGEIIRGVDLTGIRLEDADLSGVTFKDCNLSSAVFTRCTLRNTRFENVTLAHGRFDGSGLESSVFVNVDGNEVCFKGCRLTHAWFYKSRFEFAHVTDNAFAGARFLSCDFSKSDFSGSLFTCADFHLCDLNHATVHRTEFVKTRAMSCDFKGVDVLDAAVFSGSDPDERSSHWNSLEIPPLYFEKRLLATRWLTILILTHDMDRQRNLFLIQNLRARERALDAFSPGQEELFDLIPLLIHLNQRVLPMEKEGDEGLVMDHALLEKACSGISRYNPSPGTIALAKKHFGVEKLLPAPGKECHIEGLYTIGSVGTIAQGQESDIDYWVCADMKTMPPEAQTLLRLKLASIETWAKLRFSTEIHFFVMDPESIREGRFGGSDFESSGSAQSMMLKEEFYRTMILAAGKIPFWCVLPDWPDTKHYPLLYGIASRFHDDYLDLGHVDAIPPGEYFGASMWQLFKSLKSPYKSVMKMALLEKYIEEGKQGVLLCNLLKQRRASGNSHFRRDDPYILLFEETTAHYLKTAQPDIAGLIRLCFFLKLSIPDPKHLEQSVFKTRKLVIRKCLETYGWKAEELYDLGQFDQWPFKKVLDLNERINRFMIKTYNKLSRTLAQTTEAGALITAEDLTVLGRKMFVQFADQPHKVKALPHAVRGRNLLGHLYLYYRQTPGRPPSWDVFPCNDKDILTRGNEPAVLKEANHLEEVAAFAIYNGIYAAGTLFTLLPNPTAVSAQDFLDLLREMHDFFPYGDAPIAPGAYLEPVRIVKLFISVNVSFGKKADRIFEAAAIYTTSRGEMFCRSYASKTGFSHVSDIIAKLEADLNLSCANAETACHIHRQTRRQVLDPEQGS